MPDAEEEGLKEKSAQLRDNLLSFDFHRVRFGPDVQDMITDQFAEQSRILDVFEKQWNNCQCDGGDSADRIHDLPRSEIRR